MTQILMNIWHFQDAKVRTSPLTKTQRGGPTAAAHYSPFPAAQWCLGMTNPGLASWYTRCCLCVILHGICGGGKISTSVGV